MEQGDKTDRGKVTVLLGVTERRSLVEMAATRSIEVGRPVSCSQVVRDLIHQARRNEPGPRRVA